MFSKEALSDKFQSFLENLDNWFVKERSGNDLYDLFRNINAQLNHYGSCEHYTGFSELFIYRALLAFLKKKDIKYSKVSKYEWDWKKFKKARLWKMRDKSCGLPKKKDFWKAFKAMYINPKENILKIELPSYEKFSELFEITGNKQVEKGNRQVIYDKLVLGPKRSNFQNKFEVKSEKYRIGMNQRFYLKKEGEKKQIIPDILVLKGKEDKIWRIFEIKIYPAYGQQTIKVFLEEERGRREKYKHCYHEDFKGIVVCWHRYYEDTWEKIMQENKENYNEIIFMKPWFLQDDCKPLFETLEGYLKF